MLIGTETNILTDGSPDYPDDLLAQLDWVIASVHTSFRMGERAMTDRIVAAIEHPLIDAIGHPTGRKIEKRAPYGVDMERVIEAAARTGTMIEINASPDRRDLNEIHARAAAQGGVRILVNTDAHSFARLRQPAVRDRDRAPRVADRRRTSPTRSRGSSSRRCASALSDEPRQQLVRDDAVDGLRAPRREQLGGALGVAGGRVVERGADRGREVGGRRAADRARGRAAAPRTGRATAS